MCEAVRALHRVMGKFLLLLVLQRAFIIEILDFSVLSVNSASRNLSFFKFMQKILQCQLDFVRRQLG